MPVSAKRFKGKLKRDIADEAFQQLGKQATIKEVDAFFENNYGLPGCERSMYIAAKRKAEGVPNLPKRKYRRFKDETHTIALIARTRQLAHDMGGWEALEELIAVLK